MDAAHQFVGDGAFDGDVALTRIAVGPNAQAIVRGISASPLRAGRSGSCTRVSIDNGALLWLPGALVPHAGVDHTASLDVRMTAGSDALLASILVPGRTGFGESGAFARLRFRTRVRVESQVAFAEDTVAGPAALAGAAGFERFEAFVSLLALGPRVVEALPAPPEAGDGVVGTSSLRCEGLALRGLFPSLGEARNFLERVEVQARRAIASRCRGDC